VRKTGYLANSLNIPPLIFRFQYNPDLLTEKKSYKYDQANSFGQWAFDQTAAATGFIGGALGFYDDFREIGSLLVATRPLEAVEGELRSFELEFKLDASVPGPVDGDSHYGGSITPDLAVLRSFMTPTYTGPDVVRMLVNGRVGCFTRPPTCTLNYAGLSVECVMTDLSIKHTAFQDNGDPLRAEVSCTLKEQTFSIDPIIGMIKRNIDIVRSYDRAGMGTDLKVNAPLVGGILESFE
jgi:hypothetical protein